MYNFALPLNLRWIKAWTASETGINPSINIAAILGVSTRTAPITIAKFKVLFTSYLANIPNSKPIIVPNIAGSPNIPNFFCISLASSFILFIPGIKSNILFTTQAIGAYDAENPCGIDIPGSPSSLSTNGAVLSAIIIVTIILTPANINAIPKLPVTI